MVMDGVLDNYARLLPGGVNLFGPKELTQYYVQDFCTELEICFDLRDPLPNFIYSKKD